MKTRVCARLQNVVLGIATAALAIAPAAFCQGPTRVGPQYQQTQQQGQTTPVGQTPTQNQLPQQPGQQGQQPQLQAPAGVPRGGDLVLGPGDIISIQVADDPDLAGRYLVSDSGEISIPSLPNPVHATGLTTSQLSKSIAKELKDAEIMRNPAVTIFVEEYHSHTVTVLGAVVRPGLYPVETHTTVLEVISEAGGLLPSAGNLLTVAKGGSPEAATAAANPPVAPTPTTAAAFAQNGVAGTPTVKDASLEKKPVALPDDGNVTKIDLHKLVNGKDRNLNVEVKAGDVVSVGTAPIVYVVGAVTRPGAFAVEGDKSQITVLQALSLVEGLTNVARPSHAMIIRGSAEPNSREQIPIDISKVMSGKATDKYLLADDILFVPESGGKKAMQHVGQAAAGAAQYGLGLRIAAF